jgi:hypothetical protein
MAMNQSFPLVTIRTAFPNELLLQTLQVVQPVRQLLEQLQSAESKSLENP